MSSGLAFALYLVVASTILGALALVWSIGRSLHNRSDRRHEVIDPASNTWSTRLHWGHPGAGIGVARRLFPPPKPCHRDDETPRPEFQTTPPTVMSLGATPAPPKSGRKRRFEWLDVLEIFDEGILLIVGLFVTLGLFVAAVIVVLLALELILILTLAAVLGVVRSLFGHPWVIETIDPDGHSTFTSVRGLRAAVATHRSLRQSIETGLAAN